VYYQQYQQPIQSKIVNHRNIVHHNENNNIYAPKTFVYKPQSTSQLFTPNNNGHLKNGMNNNGIYNSIS
jgi:hypothetical protein